MLPTLPAFLFDAGVWLLGLVRHYVFDDFNFVGYLIVLLVLDTITGVRASLIRRTHNSRQFRQVFRKICEYAVVLVVVHVLTSPEVDGQKLDHEFFKVSVAALKFSMYLGLLWAEAKSIDENLRRAGGRGMPLPAWFRRMMADLDENGPAALRTAPEPAATAPSEAPPPEPLPATSLPAS